MMSWPTPGTSRPMNPASEAAPMAASSDAMAAVSSERTAMNASVAPIAQGRDGHALDDRERVEGQQRAIRARGRVRAVAVGDDVATRRLGRRGQAPLLAGREAGAATPAQARLARSSAIVATGPRSRMALRRPSNAPAFVAASRSSGSAAAARSSRIVGQALGVLRRRRGHARPPMAASNAAR